MVRVRVLKGSADVLVVGIGSFSEIMKLDNERAVLKADIMKYLERRFNIVD